MKHVLLIAFIVLTSLCHADAQTLKELVIEPDPELKQSNSVFSGSCNSPDLGVIVFNTAISGLWFEMEPPSKLINTRYNRQRNEYVMCVEPTEGTYRFLISHADYKAVDFFVENVKRSSIAPQFFKINPKETMKETEKIQSEDSQKESNQASVRQTEPAQNTARRQTATNPTPVIFRYTSAIWNKAYRNSYPNQIINVYSCYLNGVDGWCVTTDIGTMYVVPGGRVYCDYELNSDQIHRIYYDRTWAVRSPYRPRSLNR